MGPDAAPAPALSGVAGRRALYLGTGVVLLALNLRPALVAVSPLVGTIRDDSGMSAAATSLLTALPLLCFGLLAPVAPRLGRRLGMEWSLLGTMALICGGTALRLLDSTVALFAGTLVIGAGIAVANVLLPGLIKRDFPARAGLMTGLYSMSLFGGAALAAGVTVPVQQAAGLNWRATLACWGALAALALVCWLPQTRTRTRVAGAAAQAAAHPVRGLWRDPLAWQVTGYMGLQSLSYYAAAAWLPTMLTDAGMSPGDAGWMLSFSSLLGITGSFLAPVVVGRRLRAGVLAAAGALLCAAGFLGCWSRRLRRLPLDGAARPGPGRGDQPRAAVHRAARPGRPARRPTLQHGPVLRLCPRRGGPGRPGRRARPLRELDGPTDRPAGAAAAADRGGVVRGPAAAGGGAVAAERDTRAPRSVPSRSLSPPRTARVMPGRSPVRDGAG
ncbi:MFS transporter [Streptomyces lydicus]|nr:MFS transporter [Streptomyces lydicus]